VQIVYEALVLILNLSTFSQIAQLEGAGPTPSFIIFEAYIIPK
jgi:hypothetical protein